MSSLFYILFIKKSLSFFNKFYANHRVGDDSFKLKLCESVGIVVKSGMRLLDVEVINQM